MSTPPEALSSPRSDFEETRRFLLRNADLPNKISRDNWRAIFRELPEQVQRVVGNLTLMKWGDATQFLRRQGVEKEEEIESIHPLIESFLPYAQQIQQDFGLGAESYYINEIESVRTNWIYELVSQTPLLHLEFIDREDKVIFENRESVAGVLGTAAIIIKAVKETFEYCRNSGANINPNTRKLSKTIFKRLMERMVAIGTELGFSHEDLANLLQSPAAPAEKTSGAKPDSR